MHQILQAGGTCDESFESIDKWLTFLTDPQNLRPGLPGLTVYFGDARFCSITATFDSKYTSLRSLKLELAYVDDEYAVGIFKGDWISNIFLHPELEELDMAFMITELPDLFQKLPKLKVARLTDSRLTKLPASFFQLPALEKLSINGTSLRELPSELGNLHTLRYLEFSQTWGPAVLGKLKG